MLNENFKTFKILLKPLVLAICGVKLEIERTRNVKTTLIQYSAAKKNLDLVTPPPPPPPSARCSCARRPARPARRAARAARRRRRGAQRLRRLRLREPQRRADDVGDLHQRPAPKDVGAAAERRRHEELDGGREALHARHARAHQRPVVAGEPQPDRYLRLLDLPHRSRGSVGQPRRVSWVLRTIVLVKNCMNIDQLSERTVRRRSAAFAASSGAAAAAAARAPSGESESAIGGARESESAIAPCNRAVQSRAGNHDYQSKR